MRQSVLRVQVHPQSFRIAEKLLFIRLTLKMMATLIRQLAERFLFFLQAVSIAIV